jgi:hypothetical protein
VKGEKVDINSIPDLSLITNVTEWLIIIAVVLVVSTVIALYYMEG